MTYPTHRLSANETQSLRRLALEILSYDKVTGVLTWKISPSNSAPIGSRAGTYNKSQRYAKISLLNKDYLVHRIIYLMMTGRFPTSEIDHIDGDGLNNKWANIREADSFLNKCNRGVRSDSKSGIKGVTKKQNNKWSAQIKVHGEVNRLGIFETKEAAYASYCAAATQFFGEFARLS